MMDTESGIFFTTTGEDMQLNISGHHIEVTQALKDHASSKLQKLKQHFNQVMNVNMVLEVEGSVQKAEATVHISGHDLFAQVESSDMYHSINDLVKKLDAQIHKYKDKIQKHR